MDPLLKSIQEYVRSGEYFTDARKWYNLKYAAPIIERSSILITCLVIVLVGCVVGLNISAFFPIIQQVKYTILSKDVYNYNATITRADQNNEPIEFIANIMVKDYVKKREQYDYDKLKQQVTFVQNSSTRIVFNDFYEFIGIDNPISPIMRYQKYINRDITILSSQYTKHGEAIVLFESLAKNNGKIFENMVWQATISFEIDKINLKLPSNSKFNFVVTNYALKLLKDKTKK